MENCDSDGGCGCREGTRLATPRNPHRGRPVHELHNSRERRAPRRPGDASWSLRRESSRATTPALGAEVPLDRFTRRGLTGGAVTPIGAPRSRSGRRTGWILHRTTEPRHSRRADRRTPAAAAGGWRSHINRQDPDFCRDAQRKLRRPIRCAGGDPLSARPSRLTAVATDRTPLLATPFTL